MVISLKRLSRVCRCALSVAVSSAAMMAWAQVNGEGLQRLGDVEWKLTTSRYWDSIDGAAHDANLRGSIGAHTWWVGHYRDTFALQQTRGGWERRVGLPWGQLTTSLQSASGGFAGWALTWDTRREGSSGWAPLLGFGRTNAKPYVNLNFDPNDSVLVGASYVSPGRGLFTIYRIRDDRLGTGQTVDHFVWRRSLEGGYRLTLDLFARSGAADAGAARFRGQGFTLTTDIGDWFVRASLDPHAFYTAATVSRVSAGIRF